MHDENDNNQLDTNFLGIPSEGYGFSNNPNVMRRAHFDEARLRSRRRHHGHHHPPALRCRHATPFVHTRFAARRHRGCRQARIPARRDAGADRARKRFAAGLAREPWLAGWKTVGVESLGPTQATIEGPLAQ